MTVIGGTSNALFFNGVSDAVVVPQATFERTGLKLANGARSNATTTGQAGSEYNRYIAQVLTSFSIEAWVAPDHGGVVAVKPDLFELRIGGVGEPAPASFSVHVRDDKTGKKTFTAESAVPVVSGGSRVGWDGLVYPRDGASFMESGTSLNADSRELLHVVGTFDGKQVKIYVNAELVASVKLDKRYELKMNENDLYIGGRGGEYRGYIESVHWRRGTSDQIRALPLHTSTDSIGLWRFEEPIDVDNNDFYIASNVTAGATTINIGAAGAQTLYETITGKDKSTFTTTLNVATDHGLGNYQIATPTGLTEVAHTPFNLMLNPTVCDHKTGKANLSPPERVRLLNVATNGDLTVNSIHLDFDTAANGARGVLHNRTAFVTATNLANDSHVVLVSGDLLIDSGTGTPYRSPGIGTQMIDRTGQMVIDESGNLNHGVLFSRDLSIGKAKNPFDASSWPSALNNKFKEGHSARHKYSHLTGHPFMRVFPPAQEENVTKTIDGASDSFDVTFDGQSIGLKDQEPINSIVNLHRRAFVGPLSSVKSSSTVNAIIENGHNATATLAEHKREIIAIGGANFDVRPFLLKGHAADSILSTDNVYDLHLAPETESRIAVLEVPSLTPNAAPYVQIHYNAIDLTGGKMGVATPMLLIEKTVPAGGSVIGGSSVAAHIAAAVGAGLTIHAPGGMIRISESVAGDSNDSLKPHRLVGDNTGGRLYEIELDESLTPVNHTPMRAEDNGCRPPQGVDASHSTDPVHPSVYNRAILQLRNRGLPDPPVGEAPTYFRQKPAIDNDNTSGAFDVGASNQSSHTHEVFDIIDNYRDRNEHVLIIQPSNRKRVMQLAKAEGTSQDPNDATHVSLEYLQSRGRIVSFNSMTGPTGRTLMMQCRGLMDDINVNADTLGDGSPDSHPIKEIMPGAPVVTVTLGGPGQGAVNTKPTFDPSPLSRLGGTTRSDCATKVVNFTAVFGGTCELTVTPLNNNNPGLASWGTYCFTATNGFVYTPSGAKAKYVSKQGTKFIFGNGYSRSHYFDAEGNTILDFPTWVATVDIATDSVLTVEDPTIFNQSICQDGSTINDRLFQSLKSVNHDYQLGTQYASTRALVEIPLFPYHFFEDRDAGIFPGPDNSMALILDATMTAHSWAPNPVGRRCNDYLAADREVMGSYHYTWVRQQTQKSASITWHDVVNSRLYIQNHGLFPESAVEAEGTGAVRGMQNTLRRRRVFLENGEWAYYKDLVTTGPPYLQLDTTNTHGSQSANFLSGVAEGVSIHIGGWDMDESLAIIADDIYTPSTAQEYRNPYHLDRANVMTQGGNSDYGLRQYVSAVEFRAGPRENPHGARIESGCPKVKVTLINKLATPHIVHFDKPELISHSAVIEQHHGNVGVYIARNERNGLDYTILCDPSGAFVPGVSDVEFQIGVAPWNSGAAMPLVLGDELTVYSIRTALMAAGLQNKVEDAVVNSTWHNPYAPGGLRQGDTVWMNMHYTNPHAIEGIFAKSRGVYNEFEVWSGFNEGRSDAGIEARDTVYMENFLIGNDCLTTARNYAQHINKTIELNWAELGRTPNTAPIIAYVDPYLSTQEHARVLLYDVARDREAVAFQDLWMQVQSSQKEMKIRNLDVANGFRTQRRDIPYSYGTQTRLGAAGTYEHMVASITDIGGSSPAGVDTMLTTSGKSEFIESAYAHLSPFYANAKFNDTLGLPMAVCAGRLAPNFILSIEDFKNPNAGCPSRGAVDRTNNSVCCPDYAKNDHARTLQRASTDTLTLAAEATKVWTNANDAYPFQSTMFDTPEGTRAIPAFLALRGNRNTPLSLSSHREARLQHLPHWTQMDFTRRLRLDLGEVGVKEGVTDIEAAAQEVVRLINQAGARNGRSNQRRPADQYPGESERFDITQQGTNLTAHANSNQESDPTAAHHGADFAVTGSTHDPSPFWDDTAYSSFDRGSHMGYLRAHVGRVIEDADGVEGFTVVIHSTVPGATGRNFCVWLDNSRAQSPYRPQFLVGHGGRFRNFYCQPEEALGEMMHPAPMPINKHGRPFAPITTLTGLTLRDNPGDDITHNGSLGNSATLNGGVTDGGESTVADGYGGALNHEIGTGRSSNTMFNESFEQQGQPGAIVEGLRVGTRARSRINCGGLVQAGIPGWAPDAGKWGFGAEGNTNLRWNTAYGANAGSAIYSEYVPTSEGDDTIGDKTIYGFRMVDHIGRRHTLRMLYKQYGIPFSNDNTKLPPSLDNEVVIWFDDRDTSLGGFTLGKHMWGKGDPSQRIQESDLAAPSTEVTWRGNEFRGGDTMQAVYAISLDTPVDDRLIFNKAANVGFANDGIWHDIPSGNIDVLGHLGFPDSGMIWVGLPHATGGVTYSHSGYVLHYTSRSHGTDGDQHEFRGVTGLPTGVANLAAFFGANQRGPTAVANNKSPVLISPMLNPTTILTDEVIAGAIERAMSIDPNSTNITETSFDCTQMYAPDGRTFADWGIKPESIRIRAYSDKQEVMPLKDLFEIDRAPDWGLYAGSVDVADANSFVGGTVTTARNTHLGGLTQVEINQNKRLDVGYLPKTVLHITTRYRGTNANTATPVLVDSQDNIVDISVWRDNLRGIRYTRYPGDHVTPAIENPTFTVSNGSAAVSGNTWTLHMDNQPVNANNPGMSLHWLSPIGRTKADLGTGTADFGGAVDLSYAPLIRVCVDEKNSFVGEVLGGVVNWPGTAERRHRFVVDDRTGVYAEEPKGATATTVAVTTTMLMQKIMPTTGGVKTMPTAMSRYCAIDRARLFDGARLAGNTYGEPLVYFRGARDSVDHWVPLYFGGGFSGVVLDINDGTQNDYSEFYKHPYSTGPTGTAGIQHANETLGAYAMLDTTAMLAMFPGTALLNQHEGEVGSPFANNNAILSPDMDAHANDSAHSSTGFDDPKGAGNSYATGTANQVNITRPSPLILRFAHPHARYKDEPSASNDHTTYVIFGPGQSFPKHWKGEDTLQAEPNVRHSVATIDGSFGGIGKAYDVNIGGATPLMYSTRYGQFLPNTISNYDGRFPAAVASLQRSGTFEFLPAPFAFTATNIKGWKHILNWDPPHGAPNSKYNKDNASHVLWSCDPFYNPGTGGIAPPFAHPFYPYQIHAIGGGWPSGYVPVHGTASGAPSEDLGGMTFHMDGGYAPGGHFFDNCIRLNPAHPVTGNAVISRVASPVTSKVIGDNATIYRGCAAMLPDYDKDLALAPDTEIIVVDATRVQNSEELGAVLSGAINSFPGKGALKALGGTFAPSFGSAHQQDKYSWLELGLMGAYSTTNEPATSGHVTVQYIPESAPAYGWIRIAPGTIDPADPLSTGYYAFYYGVHIDHANNNYAFLLGPNHRTAETAFEDPMITQATCARRGSGGQALAPPANGSGFKVYMWTKAGNLRWSNGVQDKLHAASAYGDHNATRENTIYDHLAATQVHFSGAVNAVDRTRPVGAVGWHGERYSYLNSLAISNPDGSVGIGTGKGAWHAFLAFNPYGDTMSCHQKTGSLVAVDKDSASNKPRFTPVNDCPNGVHPAHYVVVSYESELPLVAKFDRDGVSCTGDLLAYRWGASHVGTSAQTGTTLWDADLHSPSRYTAPANGGPNVEALWVHGTDPPGDAEGAPTAWHPAVTAGGHLYQMDACLHPTGDLFNDAYINAGANQYYADTTLDSQPLKRTCNGGLALGTWDDDPWLYWKGRHPARNFATNHVTWKRMDGGSLSLPASNARGLGAIPFITRVKGGVPILTGEKLLGNCRFTFETTNAAMFPVIQAQELAHPAYAEAYPREVRNVLSIPNEEIQFERIMVIDDTGQEHFIEGGSPFGTIIRDFDLLSDRDVEGLAPAEAGSGNSPNMRIRLPDPDTIPGNIVVRSGFDRSQVYQNESIGTGGLQRPGDAEDLVKRSFKNTNQGPRVWPTWENNAWDHIDSDPDNFPDNTQSGWENATNDAPLRTSYEPHDRALYFHITKMGHTHTEREPAVYHTHNFAGSSIDVNVTSNPLTYVSETTNTIVASGAIDQRIWTAASEASSGRWFLSINGRIASYTGVSGSTFTGVVFTPGFTAAAGESIKPSFYVPAGSNRFFAARRLRDHAEVSGESPDMPLTQWYNVKGARGGAKSPYELLTATQLTPMPLPRMGHHYVTPTMAMMPGHLAHPLYQRLYRKHFACTSSIDDGTVVQLGASAAARDPNVFFSNLTANYPPSDIHGGAFTLMTETKIRYDGYGVLASDGVAGTQNSKGSHLIFLEAAKDYTLTPHFPDPMEVGAYQIVIQPNVYAQQLVGYHQNPDAVSDVAPFDPATSAFVARVPFLTGQQVATVIGIDDDNGQANGGIGLILASAVGADVRGCEIYVNEMMLDIDPAPGQQFTTLPPLATFNPLGVNESAPGVFTRRSLPYHPNMFRRSTPGYTITVPWWANSLSSPFAASHFKHLEQYHADDYYHFCRSTLGAISSQITLAGYPTHFYDAYTGDYSALSPICSVLSVDSGNARIVVDNNDLFPLVGIDYYNMRLELTTVDGAKMYATYNHRGYTSGGGAGLGTENTSRFETVVPEDAAFWTKAVAGSTLRLTGHWKNTTPGEVYTKSTSSVNTRNLPQLLHGTRDTNSLHMADAFLCRWHQNLGRPYTINSDSSRPNPDSPAFLQEPLNHLPESFDMVHYHEFTYAVSNGPFGFRMQAQNAHNDAARTGAGVNPESLHASNPAEGGTDGIVYHYANFWPGGTRYGASATRLDHWGDVMRGWHASTALKMGDCKTWTTTGSHGTAVTQTAVATLYGAADATYAYHRNFCFGHRFAVRQPYNRPRWAIQGAKGIAGPFDFPHDGYQHGPLIQHDIGSWTYEGEVGGVADQALTATNVGIMEQQTNASALLGADVRGHQVRYADGRRITAPFGCPVRNIVNPVTAKRLHPGDFFVGKQGTHANNKRNLMPGVVHYVVDWWGNTTGEDVRKYPVRGFGIRPTWDPEDAYALPDKNPTTVKLYRDRSHFTLPSAAEGVDNRTNRGAGSEDLVDWFNPKTALRVGDRGDGRGVRWPTVFNENVLQAVSIPIRPIGMVLSHHTAEPPFTVGLLRPTNDPVTATDIPVGISRRLGINREDGLLKPEAMSGKNVEQVETDFLHGGAFIQDAIARIAPRIGLDGMTVGDQLGDVPRSYMVQATHATSLHTDRGVGQRYTVAKDYDLTSLDFATDVDDVMKLSLTDGINPLGGSYVLYLDNYMEPVSDLNWGAQLPTSGMVLWLKADAIKGLADGAAVTQWDDSSGNGRNFTQGTVSKQPAYVASEANFGNKPAVRFDGGDKLSIAYDAELNTNQFTVFVVAAVNADNNTHEAIYESRSSYDFTLTGISLTNTDATVTHAASPVALVVGMPVSGPGIPGGAEVASITDATHFELTAAATATSTADLTVSVARAGFNLYGDMTGGAAGGFWEMWAGRAESWGALGSGHASTPLVTAASAILTAQISGGDGLGAAATQLFRKDGNELTQACTYYKSTDDFAGIGTMNTSSYMLDGEVAEIIQYNRALSAAEILEVESYLAQKYSIAHTASTRWRTSNPYQTSDHDPFVRRVNPSDKKLGLLLRPVRVLDHRHIEIFRHARRVNAGSPQDSKNYYSATAGGRYGVFVYDAPGARVEDYILTAAPAPTNPPYAPVYYVDPAVSVTAPVSVGPLIPGTESAGFQLSLRQTVGRMVVSENTLGHYKSDAARRQSIVSEDDEEVIVRPDFSVEPRHSQTTHPGTKFNTKDHGGEVSADYSEVNN